MYKPYTVKIRRGEEWIVRENVTEIDGKVYLFREGWIIGPEDTGIYVGETAMIPKYDSDYPKDAPHWIASGDLVEVKDV